MGFFGKFFAALARSPTKTETTQLRMVTEIGNGIYNYTGTIYESDAVRSCVRPIVKAVGKAIPKHIRTTYAANGEATVSVNPDPYMRLLLEEPNQLMPWQMYAEKMETQLLLNGNAFALIQRDENGFPVALFPIVPDAVEAVYGKTGELFLRFYLPNGTQWVFPYTDIIHLRGDFSKNDVFAESPADALKGLMEVIGTTDKSIVAAIKNSAVIRWLLKFTSSMRPEDIESNTKKFADSFLAAANSTGVAGTDVKADAIQIKPTDFVPNAVQAKNNLQRLLSYFNESEKIVTSSFSENEWISFYEARIEPDLIQFANEHTRKLFTRRQRAFGNRLYMESANLAYASMSTKLALQAMVDRGAMTPNEWRATLGLPPVPGGDLPIRRLDTQPVQDAQTPTGAPNTGADGEQNPDNEGGDNV